MDWNRDGEVDTSELRLTGLILAQSAMVGLAVGVFDSGVWLPAGASGDSWMNGMTYAMGALAVQMLGFYIFKMFFEQSMQQRVYQQTDKENTKCAFVVCKATMSKEEWSWNLGFKKCSCRKI